MMFVVGLLSMLSFASPADPYVGAQAVRVEVTSPAQARVVEQLALRLLDERTGGPSVDVIVDAAGLDALAAVGFAPVVLEPDVHARIVAEHERIAAAQREWTPRDFDAWFDEFKTLEEIQTHVDELVALAPERATVMEIGKSVEGRAIRVVRLGDGDPDEPAIVVTGVQHAREWLASMVPMCVIDRFVRDGATDPVLSTLLDQVTVYVVPIVNPDGFVYSWESDRYWRKNRRDGHGVDLNRNWAAGWGGELGSSPETDSDQYHGTEPFSEPETQAVRDFVQSRPEVAALVDFHSFAGVVSSSYAHTDEAPEDIDLLRAWGDGMAAQINSVHDYGYLSLHGMEANETIGYAAGTQPDWGHDFAQLHGFTIELRPSFTDEGGGGFEVPPETIVPTCEENTAAIIDLARWVTASEEPTVEIVSPADGTYFPDAPALTDVEVAVDFAGPAVRVSMYIDDQLQTWNDAVFPHDAEIEFPRGNWELVAEVETWDGRIAKSAPVTVYVGEDPPAEGGESTGDSGDDTGGPGSESADEGGTESGDDDPEADPNADAHGCGCAATSTGTDASGLAGLLFAGLAMLAWPRRRR